MRGREVPSDINPESIVRIGTWVWYRNDDGEIRERVLPDINLGSLTLEEQDEIFRGEHRDS